MSEKINAGICIGEYAEDRRYRLSITRNGEAGVRVDAKLNEHQAVKKRGRDIVISLNHDEARKLGLALLRVATEGETVETSKIIDSIFFGTKMT